MYKTLDLYLKKSGRKLTTLAEEAGVTKGRLSQLRTSTDWPPMLALKVEDVTRGELNASDLSPIVRQARTMPRDNAA